MEQKSTPISDDASPIAPRTNRKAHAPKHYRLATLLNHSRSNSTLNARSDIGCTSKHTIDRSFHVERCAHEAMIALKSERYSNPTNWHILPWKDTGTHAGPITCSPLRGVRDEAIQVGPTVTSPTPKPPRQRAEANTPTPTPTLDFFHRVPRRAQHNTR